MKKALFLAAFAVAIAGCAGAAVDDEYNKLVAQAENEIKLAGKTNFLWRDTEKFLKESKEAMAAGERDKAMKLAKKALWEAQMAQQQAKDQANPKVYFNN